VRYDPFR
jgi:hypothetical protein